MRFHISPEEFLLINPKCNMNNSGGVRKALAVIIQSTVMPNKHGIKGY